MSVSAAPMPAPAQACVDALSPSGWYLFKMSPLDMRGVPAWKAVFFARDPAAAGCEMQQGTRYGDTPAQVIVAEVDDA